MLFSTRATECGGAKPVVARMVYNCCPEATRSLASSFVKSHFAALPLHRAVLQCRMYLKTSFKLASVHSSYRNATHQQFKHGHI